MYQEVLLVKVLQSAINIKKNHEKKNTYQAILQPPQLTQKKKVHNYKYLQNSYIFNIHIPVINVEQTIIPGSSFEPQIIIRSETIYRLKHT